LVLLLPFKAMLLLERARGRKSGGPPLLAPSFKIQRNTAHNQSSGSAVAPRFKRLNARGPLKVHPKMASFISSKGCGPMNYQAFTNDSLTMMYEGIRGALASDDATKGQGQETRFRVRETPEWKKHAAELEAEMLRRGMSFEVIDWSDDQATLPFE
jgi:hypothetical protein